MASDVKGPRTKEAMKAIGVQTNVSVLLADGIIVDIAPLETLHLTYPVSYTHLTLPTITAV